MSGSFENKQNMSHAVGAVSAGHKATAQAAAEILQDGGNAFDAVVAAHITACVAEPVLASFAGGGFLLAETSGGEQTLYDFFVQTPLQPKKKEELNFFPISADFGYALQEFHVGPGSAATPGTVKGLFTIYEDLCTMPFPRLAEFAVNLARNGMQMNAFQANALEITKPIYFSNEEATDIFRSQVESEGLIQEDEWFKQPYLADFIEELAREGESFFYDGEVAEKIIQLCEENGGHLTQKDLDRFEVYKREPLKIRYRNTSLSINPPPSLGGLLIACALKLLESVDLDPSKLNNSDYADLLVHVQNCTNRARVDYLSENENFTEWANILRDPFLELYKKEIKDRWKASQGTTQISVMDAEGNLASLTTSNGSGSGVMIPGTGVMLNNMLGEEDLNPKGFYNWPENQRISSMMAPAILDFDDGRKVALGSGGSNRIRTAILQVLSNLVDRGMNLEEAIHAPRIHFENDFLNMESGLSPDVVNPLKREYADHKIWKYGNLFFGGVHAVSGKGSDYSGSGDPRRGGVSIIV